MIPKPPPHVFIGCAGWSIPRAEKSQFPASGSHLERYAAGFRAVEINSSFYRPHQRATYERWAASVPDGFRFAVKLPRTITHDARLQAADPLLERFCGEVAGLGDRLGVLLMQLPPSLNYAAAVVSRFMTDLRHHTSAPLACEPRHASWFCAEAGGLLQDFGVAFVHADPCPREGVAIPETGTDLRYYRLHGSPQMYYSDYSPSFLRSLAATITGLRRDGKAVWCIFDNTASGHAIRNALHLQAALSAFE